MKPNSIHMPSSQPARRDMFTTCDTCVSLVGIVSVQNICILESIVSIVCVRASHQERPESCTFESCTPVINRVGTGMALRAGPRSNLNPDPCPIVDRRPPTRPTMKQLLREFAVPMVCSYGQTGHQGLQMVVKLALSDECRSLHLSKCADC